MRETGEQYVWNCDTCQQSKTARHVLNSVLCPLPIPEESWEDLSVDFVTGLPEDHGYDTIMVVIDQLSKIQLLIPCQEDTTADMVQLFLQNVWKLHGLPNSIVSD